jgi:hypothetical protein
MDKLLHCLCAFEKSGSFGFAKRWLVCRAKPNVPLVRLVKIVFKKCGSAKKIKHEALGCRVGKKTAVKSICRPNVSITFCQFNGCCVGLYACL